MANGWWRNIDTDNDGNNANNWYDAESGGSPLGRVPTTGDNAYFSDTASSAACNLSANFTVDNLYMASADTGGTDDYSGTFDCGANDLTVGASLKDSNSSSIDFGSASAHDLVDVTVTGSIDLGSSTIDISGNLDAGGVNSWSGGSAQVTFSGTTKTLKMGASGSYRTIGTCIISGSYTMDTYSIKTSTDFQVTGTFTVNGSAGIEVTSGSFSTLSGTIDGNTTNTLNMYSNTATFPTGGTVSIPVWLNNDSAPPARTWGGAVYVGGNFGGTFTFGAGTHTFNGGLYNTKQGSYTITWDFTTVGVIVDINGDLDCSDTSATFTVNMGASTWDCSGNWDTSGVDTWDEATSDITLSGATKTVTLSAAAVDFYDLTISGTYTSTSQYLNMQNGGTLDVSGSFTTSTYIYVWDGATITLTGTLAHSTGANWIYWFSTSAFPSGGTLNFEVSFRANPSGGIPARTWGKGLNFANVSTTFVMGAGTHTINGNLTAYLLVGNVYTVDFATNGPTIDCNGNVDFSDTDGTLTVNMGASSWDVSGNWNSTGVDTLNYQTSTITLSGAGKTFTVSNQGFNDIVFSGTYSVTGSVQVYGDLQITADMTINTASFIRVRAGGTFSSWTSTITSGGVNSKFQWGTDGQAFPSGTGFSGAMNVYFEYAPSNALPAINWGSGTMTLEAPPGNSETYTFAAGTHTQTGTVTTSNYATATLALDFNANDPTVNFTNLTILVTDGTTNLSVSNNFNVSGHLIVSGLDSYVNPGKYINMTGSGKNVTFGGVAVSLNINAAGTITPQDDVYVINFNTAAGTWDNSANNPNVYCTGYMDLSQGGTYTKGSGQLTINGTGAQLIDCNDFTVEDITVTNAGGIVTFDQHGFTCGSFICITPLAHLRFTSLQTYNVTTLWRVYGDAANDVTIDVTAAGAADMNITAATRETGYADIQWFDNSSGSNMTVSFGTDSGNNSNLDFVNAFVWDGGGGDNNWSTAANWVGDIAPTAGNAVRFDATSTKNCTVDSVAGNFTNLDVVTGYTGTITASAALTFTTNVTLDDSTFTMGANLTVGGNLDINAGCTFSNAAHTIVLNGAATQTIALNGNTVGNVNVTNTSNVVSFTEDATISTWTAAAGSQLTLTSTKTFTVTDLSWTGSAGSLITLRASVGGSAALLNVSGVSAVSYVDAKDSNASGGNEIVATDSVDSGGNTNWDFGVVDDEGEEAIVQSGGATMLGMLW